MKNNPNSQFQFSAYPLSVIGGKSSSKLKVTRSAPGVSLKVLPAIDILPSRLKPIIKEPDTVSQAFEWDIHWFNNYE